MDLKTLSSKKNTVGLLVDFLKLNGIQLIELDETEPVQFYLYLAKQKGGKITDKKFKQIETYILEQIQSLKK